MAWNSLLTTAHVAGIYRLTSLLMASGTFSNSTQTLSASQRSACPRTSHAWVREIRRMLMLRTGLLMLYVLTMLAGCGGGGGGGSASPSAGSGSAGIASDAAPLPALSAVALEVPPALADGTFTSPHTLRVPPGYGIRLYARVPGARFLARAPNGDLLVSNPGAGTITLLRASADGPPQSIPFASGLDHPHDMVFHVIGGTMWLYVAESTRVTRSAYNDGDNQREAATTVVAGLPDASLPELRGAYSHMLKNIALGPDDTLYVSIGSSCNVCLSDTTSDPVRGAIYRYDADGGHQALVARGLRNAEGLDFLPATGALWVTVNSRDDQPYPYDADINGDGRSDLGQVVPSFVDTHPPDLFTAITPGADYGWPTCDPTPNDAMAALSFAPDFDVNPLGAVRDCASARAPDKGLPAHAAPLGFSFLQASDVAAPLRNGAVIAEHGCWDCTTLLAGYRVSFIPFDAAGRAGSETDLVTGFVTDPVAKSVWGRPVDVIPDGAGGLFISDDLAGAVYQLHPA